MKETLAFNQTPFPPCFRKPREVSDLSGWAREHRNEINNTLETKGAVLIRSFNLAGPEEFERFMVEVSNELLEKSHRENKRSRIHGKVFTATDNNVSVHIHLHSEACFRDRWPLKIAFACARPAATGGETTICDAGAVFDTVDPAVREKFEQLGVMYVSIWDPRFDRPWQTAFGTDDRVAVEERCHRNGMSMEWLPGDRLRTVNIRRAFVKHPLSKRTLWFNQAMTLHVSSLAGARTADWLRVFGEDGLLSQTYYGNGLSIEAKLLEYLRDVHRSLQRKVSLQKGDILLLDNMSMMHGREPYTGQRIVYTVMADLIPQDQLLKTGSTRFV